MSVALLLTRKGQVDPDIHLPVATEAAFGYWERAARDHGLPLVASFGGSGAEVPVGQLPGLIAELRILRDVFASSPKTVGFVSRATFLIDSLEALDPATIAEIWGG